MSSSTRTSSASSSTGINDTNGMNNTNNNNDHCWGRTPFTAREVPGLPGYYVYTRTDFEYWKAIHQHLTSIHGLRIRERYKIVPREAKQLGILYATNQDPFEELIRRAVSEHMRFMLEYYDPREPISTWPTYGDRYNRNL